MQIDGVYQCAEFLRQHHCPPTCTATCVYDDMKLLYRKTTQDMESVGITPWAKLFHTTEENVDWIVGVHEFTHCSSPNY